MHVDLYVSHVDIERMLRLPNTFLLMRLDSSVVIRAGTSNQGCGSFWQRETERTTLSVYPLLISRRGFRWRDQSCSMLVLILHSALKLSLEVYFWSDIFWVITQHPLTFCTTVILGRRKSIKDVYANTTFSTTFAAAHAAKLAPSGTNAVQISDFKLQPKTTKQD